MLHAITHHWYYMLSFLCVVAVAAWLLPFPASDFMWGTPDPEGDRKIREHDRVAKARVWRWLTKPFRKVQKGPPAA